MVCRLESPPFRMSWMCCTMRLMATAEQRRAERQGHAREGAGLRGCLGGGHTGAGDEKPLQEAGSAARGQVPQPPQTSMGAHVTQQESSQSRTVRETVSPEYKASYQDSIRGTNWMEAINPNSADMRTGLCSDTIPLRNLPVLHPKDREPTEGPLLQR